MGIKKGSGLILKQVKNGEEKMKRILVVLTLAVSLGLGTVSSYAAVTSTVALPTMNATSGTKVTGLFMYKGGVLLTLKDFVNGTITHFAAGQVISVDNYAPHRSDVPIDIEVDNLATADTKDKIVLRGVTLDGFFKADLKTMIALFTAAGVDVSGKLTDSSMVLLQNKVAQALSDSANFDNSLIAGNKITTKYIYKDGGLQAIESPVTDKEGNFVYGEDGKVLNDNTNYAFGIQKDGAYFKVNEDGSTTREVRKFVYDAAGALKYAAAMDMYDGTNNASGVTRIIEYNALGQEVGQYQAKNTDVGVLPGSGVTLDATWVAGNLGQFMLASKTAYGVDGKKLKETAYSGGAVKSTTLFGYSASTGLLDKEVTYFGEVDGIASLTADTAKNYQSIKQYKYGPTGAIRSVSEKDTVTGESKLTYYVFNKPFVPFTTTAASGALSDPVVANNPAPVVPVSNNTVQPFYVADQSLSDSALVSKYWNTSSTNGVYIAQYDIDHIINEADRADFIVAKLNWYAAKAGNDQTSMLAAHNTTQGIRAKYNYTANSSGSAFSIMPGK